MLCKKAGFYRVGGQLRVAYNAVAVFSLLVKVNGETIGVDTRKSATDLNPVNLYLDVPSYMDSGCAVEFLFYHNVGSPMSLVRDSMSPHFWMHMTGQAA